MPKLTNVSKVTVLAVVVALLIILVIVYNNSSAGTGSADNNASSSADAGAALTAASPAQTKNSGAATQTGGGQTQTAGPKAPAGPVLHFITPVKNDIWKIGTQNLISWDKPGGITGSISLVDATTQAFMGVILPQIGPNQTSYTWNTRDLLLDRANPLKKDVVPGTYILKLTFDGNNVKPVVSPIFTITN